MSQQHTPGPWAAKPSMLRAVCITSASGPVATTSSASHVSRDTNIANARLIAAAPELLAALQGMVDAYQRHFDVMPVAWQTYDYIARAAIAKATGGAA